MKKVIGLLLTTMLFSFFLAGCGNDADNAAGAAEGKEIDELMVYFVPSREPEEIITATEPLKDMLIEELANDGFTVNSVNIQVGTSFEAAGQALHAGTADVAFLPGGTYVLFDDGVDVLLTATRAGLSKDYENPADWNDGLATEATDEQVTTYRALILAGPSETGQRLAEIVNSGGELTWEDLDNASWGIMSPASPAGFIHPTLWMQDNFGKNLTDLSRAVQAESFASSMARLASEQLDVMTVFADGRRNFEENWNDEFGREGSIWEEVNVIGVTEPIFNDTISVSRNSDIMTEDLKEALQNAFINIAQTEEGLEVISIYSHEGYQVANSEDYDLERRAQELIREMRNQ